MHGFCLGVYSCDLSTWAGLSLVYGYQQGTRGRHGLIGYDIKVRFVLGNRGSLIHSGSVKKSKLVHGPGNC